MSAYTGPVPLATGITSNVVYSPCSFRQPSLPKRIARPVNYHPYGRSTPSELHTEEKVIPRPLAYRRQRVGIIWQLEACKAMVKIITLSAATSLKSLMRQNIGECQDRPHSAFNLLKHVLE